MQGGDGLPGYATPPTYETDSPHTEQGVHMRDALESKSLLRAANPHVYLLSMGARPHRLALYPF